MKDNKIPQCLFQLVIYSLREQFAFEILQFQKHPVAVMRGEARGRVAILLRKASVLANANTLCEGIFRVPSLPY